MSRKPRFPAPAPAPSDPKTFTEAEYHDDAKSVVAHAVATGSATVVREDGSPRVVISVPAPEAEGPAELTLAIALKRLVEIAESPAAEVAHRVEALEVLSSVPAMQGMVLVNLQMILSANVFGQTHLSHVKAARVVLRLLTEGKK